MNCASVTLKTLPAAVAAAIVLALPGPASAKLSSTKAQEAAMVARAMPVSEKQLQRLNNTWGRQDDYAAEAALLGNEIGDYEDGIFNDMAIANDVARLLVYSQYKDTKLFSAMDDFDRAADQLNVPDRMRYYMAKARLRSERQAPFADSVRRQWFSGLSADCRRAARYGGDAEKCQGLMRKFAQKNGVQDRLLDESLCRITQECARWFLNEAFRLRRAGAGEKALKVALRGIREIAPLTVIADTAGCAKWKSEGVLLARYDSLFVRPLCAAIGGRNADKVRVLVCDRYAEYRPLAAATLVRISTPSSDAFGLFKKAGKDAVLQHDGTIAVAEMQLWKKAKKLSAFKKEYPERYQLARRTAGQKKR
jgi:hypothetical protein